MALFLKWNSIYFTITLSQ